VLRYFLLSSHYRGPIDFSFERLGEAHQALERLYATLARTYALEMPGEAPAPHLPGPGDPPPHGAIGSADAAWRSLAQLADRVREALEDDFNTAQAIGHVFETVRTLNVFLAEHEKSGGGPTPFTSLLGRMARMIFEGVGEVLGVLRTDPNTFLRGDGPPIAEEEIERLLAERNAARKAKDFKRADALRAELLAKGIVLEDGPRGTTWKVTGSRGEAPGSSRS
jgi:cysteinyl-tRNA synthetase